MKASVYYLFALFTAYSFKEGLGATDFTDPSSGSVIPNFEGTQNATTITCNVSVSVGGPQITTQWNVENFRGSGPDDLQAVTVAPELFFVSGDPIPNTNFLFDNELTILNWAAELDGVIVYCGIGQDPQQASFTLRIYRPPNLRDNFLVMIEENELDAAVDLRQTPAAFPEPTMYTWYKDGQRLTRFDQTFSNVTIPSVQRSDDGNYSVIATNFVSDGSMEQVGNDTGSFYLDVLYGPSFRSGGPQQMPTQAYVLLGNPLSLVCGRGLDSNPGASITWLDPNNIAIMDNARYDLENGTDVVRLNFTRTIPNDNGMWTCEVTVMSERYVVSGGGNLVRGGVAIIGSILRHQFIVTVIAPPGQPRSLSPDSVSATWVRICWEPPFDIDFPITRYEIIARPLDTINAMVVNMSTPDNNTFVNVTDLNPGTTYNFSVVAVIQAGEVIARGVESVPLGDVMTATTVPEVSCPRPVSQNGNIIVMWTLVHTGGLPLTNLSVTYSFQQGLSTESKNVSVPGGIGARSVTVPNLAAGEEYIFNVTAENMNGSSTVQCEGILHEVGIPATPEFGVLTTGPGSGVITVQIKTIASGVNMPVQGFNFRITPVLAGTRLPERQFDFPSYIGGQFMSIPVDNLQPGESYIFSATAMNTFGTSGSANSPAQFAGGDSPPDPDDPAAEGSNVTVVAVGVAVPVIVLAIVIIIVVLLVLFFISRNRGKKLSLSFQTEAPVYDEPDNFLQSASKDDVIELKECPAYEEVKKDTIELEECPAYGKFQST